VYRGAALEAAFFAGIVALFAAEDPALDATSFAAGLDAPYALIVDVAKV